MEKFNSKIAWRKFVKTLMVSGVFIMVLCSVFENIILIENDKTEWCELEEQEKKTSEKEEKNEKESEKELDKILTELIQIQSVIVILDKQEEHLVCTQDLHLDVLSPPPELKA